ncbi:MAG: ribonuclease HIII [Kiritimatiellae bacterium]|jgi:ribonuclease HIII|nr:ribonuclease HIII [Kiritimatiellia bacterium]
MATKKNSYTFVLDKNQQDALVAMLQMGNYRPKQVPHTIIAAEAENCNVSLYKSGKCLIQGRGAEDFVIFFMEPNILQSASLGYEEVLNPELTTPHMGIDESGKGDYFGALVACAAYVNPDIAKKMDEIGVKDCKKLTDKAVFFIGAKIRGLLGSNRYKIVNIGPETYNRLYAKMRNVNTMLAWAHARCIENLLDSIPDCPRAVADQFGAKHVIERALMKNGRKIELEQRHKAESDIAVAAASVLAREAFLHGLQKLGKGLDFEPHKGASEMVKADAVAMVKKHGPDILLKTSKCHFQTTDKVLATCGKARKDMSPEGQVVARNAGKPFVRKKKSE